MPSVTAAASWMDTMKMPVREIRKKYTKSELVMMAWDSRQKAYSLRKMRDKPAEGKESAKLPRPSSTNSNGIKETSDAYEMPEHINNGVPILKNWFDEAGEIDLRNATGPQALRYMQAIGVNISAKFV